MIEAIVELIGEALIHAIVEAVVTWSTKL